MALRDETGKARYTEAEWQARVELAACYRIADHFGFSDIVWGHITAKVPGTGRFLINRFGLCFDEVTASNLVTVDIDGNVIDPGNAETEEPVNRTGFVIHSAIHAARPDVHCIMHVHTDAGMAVSVLEEGLLPTVIDAMPFFNRVASHPFEGLSVDTDERGRLATDLGDSNAMILRNHGLLTCGATVGEAFMGFYYLERACDVQLKALATGRALNLPPDDVCERAAKQSEAFAHGRYEWPALLRLAERLDPGFRE